MRKRILFILPILCLVMSSCKMDAWSEYDGKDVYVSCGTPTDYNVDEFLEIAKNEFALDQSLIDQIKGAINYTTIRDMIARLVPIVYKTVDPAGKEVLASGVVVYPVNKTPRGVIDVLPFGYLCNDQSAWTNGLSTEQVLVFLNQIIITADMLDQGASARDVSIDLPLGADAPGNDMYHPLLNMDNSGRVAYDMHIAAAQFFEKELGEKLPKHTSIFGYSEGATDAIALNRWIDLYGNGNIIVDKTFSGGGAHDPLAAFKAFQKTNAQFYPIIPSIVYSIDFWDTSMSLNYETMFTGPLLEDDASNYRKLYNRDSYVWTIKEQIYGTEYSIDELYTMNDLDVYLSNDFFVEDWSNEGNEYKKILPYLEKNFAAADPDWTPRNPIYLYHAQGDVHIPEVCSANAYEELRNKGANVSYESCPDFVGTLDPHKSGAVRFFVSCCGFFALD